MEVRNEVEDENKPRKDKKTVIVAKSVSDIQRLRLEKLMKDPTKLAHIPERKKEYTPRAPREFVRNVYGSSAGVGSGDFHIYRGVRRREYARQTYIEQKAKKDSIQEAWTKKQQQNKTADELRTSKKRDKRQRKKAKKKLQHEKAKMDSNVDNSDGGSGDEGTEEVAQTKEDEWVDGSTTPLEPDVSHGADPDEQPDAPSEKRKRLRSDDRSAGQRIDHVTTNSHDDRPSRERTNS